MPSTPPFPAPSTPSVAVTTGGPPLPAVSASKRPEPLGMGCAGGAGEPSSAIGSSVSVGSAVFTCHGPPPRHFPAPRRRGPSRLPLKAAARRAQPRPAQSSAYRDDLAVRGELHVLHPHLPRRCQRFCASRCRLLLLLAQLCPVQ
eukprot:1936415-Rhodomonas_salina.1